MLLGLGAQGPSLIQEPISSHLTGATEVRQQLQELSSLSFAMICVLKASSSFGSAEQAHFLSLSRLHFSMADSECSKVLAEFTNCESDVGLSLF